MPIPKTILQNFCNRLPHTLIILSGADLLNHQLWDVNFIFYHQGHGSAAKVCYSAGNISNKFLKTVSRDALTLSQQHQWDQKLKLGNTWLSAPDHPFHTTKNVFFILTWIIVSKDTAMFKGLSKIFVSVITFWFNGPAPNIKVILLFEQHHFKM